ncbi:TPA: bifunctional diaminohydroxyphosphoribosylaminopyrimidine deaminase/5-amino-6-(5-phosphoribosylamino)uracil reductase RibD [Candidatus Acetothermia bacterium]|nr:bifunctional diaminohydroxyphosphoribosylaminopyrimidine deaminase/5-amino-6-(5-phosphoribosylamino)uracil reductase RibD [Candidatus Acetothermia bacterium]HAZ30176.1 bifunctional diaminohydroxyphosphoribosylaminopyrimidine deaminase/5-amino-6-(5-phosphoribosylamino)uracil reductase RibD [Candidatus Acetothermia bacterium]
MDEGRAHEAFMRRALELARLGAGWTRPNPLVGAVVVRDGQVIAEGHHAVCGGPHAEAVALLEAGDRARGAELYLNIEPCVEFPGKRTPPCTNAILRAGIQRVIVATLDPNPHVSGRGVARLREAGLEVVEGVLAAEARRLNEVFFHWIRERTPFVVLKLAMSLDGKIATSTGRSRWITGPESRRLVHALRARYGAVLVGVGTVLADDPELTVRDVEGPPPLRVVLDSQGRMPPEARVLSPGARTLVATTGRMPAGREGELCARGADVWRLPSQNDQVDLRELLRRLGEETDSLLVEGGSEVAWAFLSPGLVHKLAFFYAPLILGGREAIPAVGGEGVADPAEAIRVRDVTIEHVGADHLITGYPTPQSSG